MRYSAFFLTALSVVIIGTSGLTIDKRQDSSSAGNSTDGDVASVNASVNSTSSGNQTATDPLCNQCPLDIGICCPDSCQSDGHCPQADIENAGWTVSVHPRPALLSRTLSGYPFRCQHRTLTVFRSMESRSQHRNDIDSVDDPFSTEVKKDIPERRRLHAIE
ncbi:hypothetical protein EDD37DRAFT_608031 [Exophiala viscosa]|uniref:uncharacterized protein n=1 Tax=Exophiala viscosa TaxID=2486360 RepID=UPI0021958EF0|nr:hypothetical protein EDD37DRAFT_608031 [Exophiala viscosa]